MLAVGGAETVQELSPITVTVPIAVKLSGLGRSTVWSLLATGQIKSAKAGRRRLVFVNSLNEYLSTLPPAETGKQA